MNWQLQDAKNKFSEVVNTATKEGPQIITRHGKEVVVVMSFSEYSEIKKHDKGLVDFFRSSPLVGELKLDREKSYDYREISL